MITAKFKYTDAKNRVTNRKVLVVGQPTNKLTAIDVGDISDDQASEFAAAYDAAQKAFFAQVDALKAAYDLKYSFRQFIEGNIENLEITKNET